MEMIDPMPPSPAASLRSPATKSSSRKSTDAQGVLALADHYDSAGVVYQGLRGTSGPSRLRLVGRLLFVMVMVMFTMPMCVTARAEVIVVTSPWAGGTIVPGDTVRLDDGASVDGAVENDGTLQFNTTLPMVVGAANVISGSGALRVTNSGTVTLSAANTYGGATTISAGRLSLSGGDNRLPTSTGLTISGGSLDVGTTSQTVRNFGATGGTILGVGTLAVSTATGGVRNVTMTNLGRFDYDAGSATVSFGGQANGESGTVVLSAGSNEVRAGTINLPVLQNSSAANTSGQLQFGTENVLHADNIRIGRGVRTSATAQFSNDLTDPSLTIRAQNGTGRAAIEIGWVPIDTGFGTTGTLNTEAGTLDALVSTLVVGHGQATNSGGGTGSLLMGGGTLDATTIILGRSLNSQPGNGTLRVTGGTVVVGTLNMGIEAGVGAATAAFTLRSGGTLAATTVTPGAGASSTFTWNDGTISNKAGGNLTIGAGFTTFNLATTGSHVFSIDANRTGSVATNMSGVGKLTKTGAGTLVLSGSNTYAGGTDVTQGGLLVNGSIAGGATIAAGAELGGSGTILGDVTVASSGTLSPGNSPGVLTVGSLSLSEGSTTLMEITGTAAGLYDQIVAMNNIAYGGLLQLTITGSYANDTVFQLFQFGSESGDFSSLTMAGGSSPYAGLTFGAIGTGGYGADAWVSDWTTPSAPNGQRLVFYQNTGVLAVVPEPSTYAMALAGLAFGGWQMFRRRRLKARAAPVQLASSGRACFASSP